MTLLITAIPDRTGGSSRVHAPHPTTPDVSSPTANLAPEEARAVAQARTSSGGGTVSQPTAPPVAATAWTRGTRS